MRRLGKCKRMDEREFFFFSQNNSSLVMLELYIVEQILQQETFELH